MSILILSAQKLNNLNLGEVSSRPMFILLILPQNPGGCPLFLHVLVYPALNIWITSLFCYFTECLLFTVSPIWALNITNVLYFPKGKGPILSFIPVCIPFPLMDVFTKITINTSVEFL